MLREVYRSAATMFSELLRQDVHAHNLANADTTGFKRCIARAVTGGNPQNQTVVSQSVDLRPGEVKQTGSTLDVALRSPGYFVVDTGAGRLYTRNGHFTLDSQGYLVTTGGYRVLGTQGPLRLTGSNTLIAEDGTVYSDKQRVDRLLVVDFPSQSALRHQTGSAMTGSQGPVPVAAASVMQGALEGSNVDPVVEVVAMTDGYRLYEANARAINAADQTLGKLIEATTA